MATILVADDDLDTRHLIARKLIGEGHHVVLAVDGESALAHVRLGWMDLLVLDVRMPGGSGVEVTRAVRNDSRIRGIPIILVSASVSLADHTSGFTAGADDFVTKPFSPADLARRVAALLR